MTSDRSDLDAAIVRLMTKCVQLQNNFPATFLDQRNKLTKAIAATERAFMEVLYGKDLPEPPDDRTDKQ